MLGSLDLDKLGFLLALGLFDFSPERLPTMAAEAGKALRRLRTFLTGRSEELRAELGPEVGELDLRVLHPRELVRRHLFEQDPDQIGPAGLVPAAAEGERRPLTRTRLPCRPGTT